MLSPFAPDPDALTDHELEQARWHPERETLELAAAGAAKVLGASHTATRAFAKAAATMDLSVLDRRQNAVSEVKV